MTLKPIADAGPDQVAVLGRVVGLDGSASFDPDTPPQPLSYSWWLIRAPSGSSFLYESAAVGTKTNQFFEAVGIGDAVSIGDILVVNSIPFEIIDVIPPDEVHLALPTPDPLPTYTGNFVVVRQGACIGASTEFFAFAPDVQGIYVAQLVVNDGTDTSDPDLVAINVLAQSVPLSIPLDMGFFWNYLSDYWEIVQNKEWVTSFWAGLARIFGAVLQDLWNIDFDKSLLTTQNVVMRRWRPYHPRLDEPHPTQVVFHPRRAPVWSSKPITDSDFTAPSGGTSFDIRVYDESGPTQVWVDIDPTTTNKEVPEVLNSALSAAGYSSISFKWEAAAGVSTHFYLVGRSTVYIFEVMDSNGITGIYFPATTTSTFSGVAAFRPSGVLDNSRIVNLDAPFTGSWPSSQLEAWDPDNQIKRGDIINLGGRSFEIAAVHKRFLASTTIPYAYLQIELTEDLPEDWPRDNGVSWCIPSYWESPTTEWYAEGVTPGDRITVERRIAGDQSSAVTEVEVSCAGARSRKIGTLDPQLFWPSYDWTLARVRRYFYIRIADTDLSIPRLQEKIEKPPWVMEENKHFVLDERRDGGRYIILDFRAEPPYEMVGTWIERDILELSFLPDYMWAEIVHVDNRPTIERNFGRWVGALAADYSGRDDNYLSVVTGLWYILTSGPTPANMATAAALIAGYPYAEAKGEIIDLVENFLPGFTYALVRDAAHTVIVRSYVFSSRSGLATNPATGSPYAIGDTIEQFALWVKADIYSDYITDPDWWVSLRASGALTEPEKLHRFAITLDVDYATVERAAAVLDFIINYARKTHTYPLLFLLRSLTSTITVSDALTTTAELLLPTWLGPSIPPPMIDLPRLGTGVLVDPNPNVADDQVLFWLTNPGTEGVTIEYVSAVSQTASATGTDVLIKFIWGVTTAADVVSMVSNTPEVNALVGASLLPGSTGAGTIQGEFQRTQLNYRGAIQSVADHGWLLAPLRSPSRLMEWNNAGASILSGSLNPTAANTVSAATPGPAPYWSIEVTNPRQFSNGTTPAVTDVHPFEDWLVFYSAGVYKTMGRVVGAQGPSGGFGRYVLDVEIDPALADPSAGDTFLVYRGCPSGVVMDWGQPWTQDTRIGPALGDNAVEFTFDWGSGVWDVGVDGTTRWFSSASGYTSLIPEKDYFLFFDSLRSVRTYGKLLAVLNASTVQVQLVPATLPGVVLGGWFVIIRDPPYTAMPEGPIAPFIEVPFGADAAVVIPGSGVVIT